MSWGFFFGLASAGPSHFWGAMSEDLNTEIKISANADGVEAGVSRAKRSLASLSQEAERAGDRGAAGLGRMGAGGDLLGRRMDSVTKNVQASLQRQIAALEAGGTATRQYQETIARMRGADLNALKPWLDQLDAAKAKAEAAGRAQQGLETRMGALGTAASFASGQLAALMASITVAGMLAWVKSINDGVDALNDIKDATGSSIENISALETVGKRTGAAFDTVGSILVKFNDVLSKATPKSEIAMALKAIGLEADALKKMDPAEALRITAVALSGYADDANKARLIQDLFGKSVKEAAPFLADLAEQTSLVSKVTTQQADEADRLNKQFFALQANSSELSRQLVSRMVPGLTQITEAMAAGAKEGGLLLGIFRGLAEFGAIAFNTDQLGQAVTKTKDVQAEMVRLQRVMDGLEITLDREPQNGAARRRFDNLRAQMEALQREALKATDALKGVVDPPAPAQDPKPSVNPPKSPAEIAAAEAAAKAALTDALAAQMEVYKAHDKALLDSRKAFQDQMAALAKQGTLGEMDVIEQTAAKEEEIWAQRRANFQAEIAFASKKQNSAAEVARINSQMQDAERDYLQSVAKSRMDAQQAELKYSEALEGRIAAYEKSARAGQEQLRTATLEGQTIGVTGAALGELTKARMEDSARELERQAVTMDGIDLSGRAGEALRAQAQAMRDAYKVNGNNSAAQAVYEYGKAIREQNDAISFELSLMGLSEQARETAMEQYRIEIGLLKQIEDIKARTAADPARRDELIASARADAAIARANASSKVFLDNWKESVKQYDDIFRQGFADMLNNGQDGWKSFTRSLVTTFKTTVADQIYKMFAQPFVVQIVGQLVGMTGGGSVLSALGGAAPGGIGASDMLSMGRNIYSAITGGFQGLSSTVAGYVQSGFNLLTGSGGMISQGPIQVGGAASGIGTLAGYGAGIAGGIMGGRLISGGYSAIGSSGNTAVNAGTAIGALLGGPFGAFLGGVAGGAVNRLFGRKLKDSGIEGTFGGESGFEGRTFEYYKGGLFRSNKTKYGELGEDLRSGLADQFDALRTGAADMAEVLGLGTAAIDNFSASIKVSFKDLDEEGIQKALKEEFDKVAETLASATLGTTEYTRAGETSVEALARLSGSLSTVNGVFDNLGNTLYASSLAGADMASSLLDLFGGADGFNAASGTYFQNFYSADEQRAAMQRQLQAQLGKIDLKLPDIDATDARAQYRALAEAQDLTTESGRKAYAMLLQLAGSFASITDAASSNAEELARVEAERQKKITDTRAGLDERLLAAQGNDRGVLDLRRKQEYDALYKLDPALAALVAQIYALEDASTAAAAAAQQEAEAAARAAEIESARMDLQGRLLSAQGNDRGALDLQRRREYDELYRKDPALAALIDQIWHLEDAASAAAAAAELAATRMDLEERLLSAQGNDRAALDLRRRREYDELYRKDPALAALIDQIWHLDDAASAAAAAAELAATRMDLEERLLTAQGNNRAALDLRRRREYDELYRKDPALAALIDQIWALDDAASAAAEAERARGNAMRDLADAMGRQREVWESQLEAIDTQRQVQQETLGLITGIFDLVRSNARDLYGEVGATAAMQASQGNAFIAQALANARRTGYLPEQDALQEAISAARGGLDSSQYKTQVDADFARLVLAGQLKGLEDIAGPQKTAAEQQIERLDAQTENLQRLIREAQKEYELLQRQVDIANGTYNATITVAEATAKIIELLGGKKPAGNADDNGGAVWGGSAPTPAGTGSGAAPAPAKYSRVFWAGGSAAGYEAIRDQSLIDRLDKLAPVYHSFDGTGDLLGLREAFKQAGGTIADLSILSGNYEADWRKAFAAVGIPAFAVGTNYVPYDTPAVVHKGERIIPAADNRALMAALQPGPAAAGNAELVAEVRALREDNRALGGEVVRLQNRLAKVIEKWDGDGLPHERDEAVTA